MDVSEELELPPTYREIADLIRAAIDDGLYEYGSQLPSAAVLARQYGVGVTTIHRAMALLEAAGDVKGAQGRGRFVTRR